MQRTTRPRRWGHTLAELVVVIALLAIVSAVAVHVLRRELDRVAVGNAVVEAAGAMARARDEALARRAIVTVRVDTAQASLSVRAGTRRLARLMLGHAHGVRLSASRDSIAFDARGLGYGAANLTLVARRGAAADTLVVSRLGRVRR